MSCREYDQYQKGKMDDRSFQKHLESCPACMEKMSQDDTILKEAKELKVHIHAPYLWTRIEAELSAAQKNKTRRGWFFSRKLVFSYIGAGMVLILVISLGIWIGRRSPMPDSGFLAERALERVERLEADYEKAIAKLEAQIQPKLDQMDLELALLYRDRLETIDEQIEQCKEALAENPANAHIRHYLLAALKDKKGTLKEVIRYEPQKEVSG
jgi:tetratricopeptide (TPR) repeat protein